MTSSEQDYDSIPKIKQHLKHLCRDLSEDERDSMAWVIKKHVLENDEINNISTEAIVAASAFMLSKCITYSEKPIPYKEIIERYREGEGFIGWVTNSLRQIKTVGALPEVCEVTPYTLLPRYKKKIKLLLYEVFKCELTEEGFEKKYKKTREMDLDDRIRIWKQGKNPYVISATYVYLNFGKVLTQRVVGSLFNVTCVSIRRNGKELLKLLPDFDFKPNTNKSYHWAKGGEDRIKMMYEILEM